MTSKSSASPIPQSSANHSRRILDAFRVLVQTLHTSAKAVEGDLGISGAQLFVLEKIKNEGASINQLAEQTLTHQSSVSVVVERLAEKAFVRREADPQDRRRTLVQITERGRRVLEKAPMTPQAKIAKAIAKMPAGEQAQLARLLFHLLESAGLAESHPNLFFEEKKDSKHEKRSSLAPW